MGKTTRWLKRLVAKIRSHPTSKEKRSLVKPPDPGAGRAGNATSSCVSAPAVRLQAPPAEDLGYAVDDAGKHAIAVATASAAAAEAALAAAQAAAAVVRLTASGRCYAAPPVHVILGGARETSAALVIQSHFRGYLARRALRALKGLVKLQALVRGHIMRRKTAETMRSMEAMLRAQARARSMRAYDSPFSSGKSSQFHHPGPSTPEKLEQSSYTKITSNTHSPMSKGSGSRSVSRVIIHPDKGYLNSSPGWSDSQLGESNWLTRGRIPHHKSAASCSTEEDYHVKTDKILEVDTGEKNLNQSIQDEDTDDEEENAFCTAENSPQFFAATSRRQSQTTPAKSDTSAASWQSGYSDCPSYMSYTESSRAKMRSLSAPRQRPHQQQLLGNERVGSKKRWSNVHQQNASSAAMQARFASKAYPGSGHLDRLGMPIRNNSAGVYYSGCLN